MQQIDEVRYGFHGSDLFEGWVEEDPTQYDHAASAEKYAKQVKARLEQAYTSAEVEVVYDLNCGGVLPLPLQPMVDGATDSAEVGFVEHIAGSVFEAFEWLVEKSA